MSRELLLMRHGKSDWDVDVDDFNRPLKNRGKRGAQRMGAWLQDNPPDYIISSPAVRARNTAEKLAKAMGQTAKHVHLDSRIYEASIKQLKAVLADCPADAQRIMLVGHNPGLEELLCYLNNYDLRPDAAGKLLVTATLAILNMPDDWSRLKSGCGHVVSITPAATLNKSFPFQGLTGLEQRDRPAYYYSQSAALPYRLINNQLQILLISSSGKNHWTIPKGIIEPGLTAHASAQQEAWEEAGIEGCISEQMLGSYQYSKWGAHCTVQVYPLKVNHIIADQEWEENHRNRQWFSLKKAQSLVKQAPLRQLLQSFNNLLIK